MVEKLLRRLREADAVTDNTSATPTWLVVDAEFSDRLHRYRAMEKPSNYEMIGQWVASSLHDGAIKVTITRGLLAGAAKESEN